MINSKIFIISVGRNDIPIAGCDNNHIGAIMEIMQTALEHRGEN